jgi:hypothetical protein
MKCTCGNSYLSHDRKRQGLNLLPVLVQAEIQKFLSEADNVAFRKSIQLYLEDSKCFHPEQEMCECFHHAPVDACGVITIGAPPPS